MLSLNADMKIDAHGAGLDRIGEAGVAIAIADADIADLVADILAEDVDAPAVLLDTARRFIVA
jgi:hypothetical protein